MLILLYPMASFIADAARPSAFLLRLFQSDLFYLCRAPVQSPAVPSAVVALRLRTGTDIHLHLVRALHGAKEQQRE